MNKKRIQKLIDYLSWIRDKRYGQNFNQKRYLHGCGTPACIAGHTCALMQSEDYRINSFRETMSILLEIHRDEGIFNEARDWLDLSDDQASILFDGKVLGADIYTAVEVLENLLDTDTVEWGSETIHENDLPDECLKLIQSYCLDDYPENEQRAIDNLEEAFIDESLPVSVLLEDIGEYQDKVDKLIYS